MRAAALIEGEVDRVGVEVLNRMRRDIVDGVLASGEKLKFEALRHSYGAAMGTLREALLQLVTEGLVTVDAGRGFRVAEVSEQDLADLTAIRIGIERQAIEDSVAHGDDDWEARVIAASHRLSKIQGLPIEERLKIQGEWVKRHGDFHDSLVSACRSPRILQFRAILFGQAERYRLLATRHAPLRQEGEHDGLKEAALAHDAKLAGDLLVQHITVSTENVLRYTPQLAKKPGR